MIGVLSVSLGIALSSHGEGLERFRVYRTLVTGILAIVAGAIAFVAGVLGVMSYKDQRSHSKAGFHMGFSITACCISFVAIFFGTVAR